MRRRPALGLYLAALAALPFRWLSPVEWLHDRAIWSDVLVAAAAAAWLWEQRRGGLTGTRVRAVHVALGAYMIAAVVSALFADGDSGTVAANVVLVVELAVLALLTSAFASERAGLEAIVLTVALVSLATAAMAVAGLALFYLDVQSGLIGAYGEQFIESDRYARVAAGFHSPPLLGSFCIFAAAVVARESTAVPRRLRRAAEAALAVTVLLTFSRAVLGFAAAAAIRHASRRKSRRARTLAVAVTLGAVVAMAALTVGRLHLDPTRPSTVTYEVPDPGNRREAFETSLDTLADHPVVGLGPGSLAGTNRGEPFRAHLTPLNVAATLGLPALLALVGFVALLWRHRRRRTDAATWSGLAGLGIDSLGQDVEHFRHVWVMLGLADADRANDVGRERRDQRTAR